MRIWATLSIVLIAFVLFMLQHGAATDDQSVSADTDELRISAIHELIRSIEGAYGTMDFDFLSGLYRAGGSDSEFVYLGAPHLLESDKEHLETLRAINEGKTADLEVNIDSIRIAQDVHDQYLYGATFYLKFSTSDIDVLYDGYIFLLLDFIDSNTDPAIHVAVWQPERSRDGTLISVYEFHVIR